MRTAAKSLVRHLGQKHAFLKERGCQHPIDSGKRHSVAGARSWKESGLDLVLDPIGGEVLSDSYNLLSETGRLVCFGVSSMSPGKSRSFLSALGMLIEPVGLARFR